MLIVRVVLFASRSPSSTGICRNCKAERRDLGLNIGSHSCV